tara:strand:+ start:198 stop:695 length:498 start_codon:yes stop_codon:yes gene_type:complete
MTNAKIKIISCGGTFEKIYNPITGCLDFEKSNIENLIQKARINEPIQIDVLMLVDSLDMTIDDRRKIVNCVLESPQEKIIIIHGTDTMVETAIEIAKNLKPSHTIILTGAMVPVSIKHSDAFFNLGFALASLKLTKPGVWLAMNGELFSYSKVRKNTKAGCFESI